MSRWLWTAELPALWGCAGLANTCTQIHPGTQFIVPAAPLLFSTLASCAGSQEASVAISHELTAVVRGRVGFTLPNKRHPLLSFVVLPKNLTVQLVKICLSFQI